MYPLIPEFLWPYTMWVFLLGSLGFAAAIVYRLWNSYMRFKRREELYFAYDDIVHATAYCYGAGLFLKFSGFGPDWLRWHLGDFGFPVALAIMFLGVVELYMGRYKASELTGQAWRIDRIYYIKLGLKTLAITYLLSIAYELFAGYAASLGERNGTTTASFGIGGFDWVDVLMYTLGASVAAFVWVKSLRMLQRNHAITLVHEEAVAEKKRLAKVNAGTGARKYATKRKRR